MALLWQHIRSSRVEPLDLLPVLRIRPSHEIVFAGGEEAVFDFERLWPMWAVLGRVVAFVADFANLEVDVHVSWGEKEKRYSNLLLGVLVNSRIRYFCTLANRLLPNCAFLPFLVFFLFG